MNTKVRIEITEGHTYSAGGLFTSVDFEASTYGSCSPCNTDGDVDRAVAACKAWIRREGDIPVVVDLRRKASLLRFV